MTDEGYDKDRAASFVQLSRTAFSRVPDGDQDYGVLAGLENYRYGFKLQCED